MKMLKIGIRSLKIEEEKKKLIFVPERFTEKI